MASLKRRAPRPAAAAAREVVHAGQPNDFPNSPSALSVQAPVGSDRHICRRRVVCQHCGTTFAAIRASRRFCSNACKKAAARIEAVSKVERDRETIDALKSIGFIGKLWPVMKSDTSAAIYGLIVPLNIAVDEINLVIDHPTTASELTAALRRAHIFSAGSADDFVRFRGGNGKRKRRSYGAKSLAEGKSYRTFENGSVTTSQPIENIDAENRRNADPRSARGRQEQGKPEPTDKSGAAA